MPKQHWIVPEGCDLNPEQRKTFEEAYEALMKYKAYMGSNYDGRWALIGDIMTDLSRTQYPNAVNPK